MSVELLPDALLSRKAIVYVRQSTQTQVQTNLESQRRQYDLVEVARRYGFVNVALQGRPLAGVPCKRLLGLDTCQIAGSFGASENRTDSFSANASR